MRRKTPALCGLLCTLAVLGVAAAPASATSPVVSDCNANGRLTQHYSVSQLQNALTTMPADVEEYTDCYDVIHRALLAQIATPTRDTAGTTQSSSGSFLPTPVIVVIIVLAVAGVALGGFAIRRRSSPPGV